MFRYEHLASVLYSLTCDTCRTLIETEPMATVEISSSVEHRNKYSLVFSFRIKLGLISEKFTALGRISFIH